jgi:hypothetical protein
MAARVVVTREEGRWWLADVPAVPGAHTCSETTLGSLDTYVREVTVPEDLPDAAIADLEFRWELHLSDGDSSTRSRSSGTRRVPTCSRVAGRSPTSPDC